MRQAQTAKDYSEQFYTDLRWSMSAWLLQQRFDTHDKTSLGAPNRRFAMPQSGLASLIGVGHNEHLLHHRCGGRDHSSRRFFGPASIRKSCKPCPRAVPSGHDTRARHRAFGFWIAGATLIVAKPGALALCPERECSRFTNQAIERTRRVENLSWPDFTAVQNRPI
jgi:hypothetical protein